MKFWICDLQAPTEGGTVFFNVMLELPDDGVAVLMEGFKYFEGRIYPPSKPWKGKSYTSVLLSPVAAQMVAAALKSAGFENPEFDDESWSAAKWGQSGLKRLCNHDEVALEVWARYKEKK